MRRSQPGEDTGIPGKGNRECKGPETGMSLAYLRNRKKTRGVGGEGSEAAGKAREEAGDRLPLTTQASVGTLYSRCPGKQEVVCSDFERPLWVLC